jgi:hypothetical protein
MKVGYIVRGFPTVIKEGTDPVIDSLIVVINTVSPASGSVIAGKL